MHLAGVAGINPYGIMLSLGAIAALAVAYFGARRRGEDVQHLPGMAIIVIPLGVIGARAYHVIDQWSYYVQHPAQIIGGQGLGIFGALAGGAVGLIIYTRWKKIGTLRWLDILAPGVILAQGIGRWGNFFNQELYGYPTDLPWGIYIDPANRLPGYESYTHFQPLFLYESLLDVLSCVLLIVLAHKKLNRLKDGDVFLLYVTYYSVVRFILEGYKIEVWTIGGFPTARWLTALAFVVSVLILVYRHCRPAGKKTGRDETV